MNNGLGAAFVRTIVLDPVTPTTLYITISSSNSYFRSTDGGTSWTHNLITGPGIINGLAIDPNAPATLYAATNRGIFKSTDSGANWTASNSGIPLFLNISSVSIDKTNNLLYAPTSFGIFKSADGADTWTN